MEADVHYDPYTPERKETGVALFKTAKGAVIRLLVSFGAYTSYDHNYRICGTRGTIETDRTKVVDNAHSLASLYSVPGTFGANSKIDIPVTTCYEGEDSSGHGGADGKMVKAFINCLVEGKKPELDVEFAINMSLPGILAHESAVQGGVPIEIPQI
jgi:predicted dehydrogenase